MRRACCSRIGSSPWLLEPVGELRRGHRTCLECIAGCGGVACVVIAAVDEKASVAVVLTVVVLMADAVDAGDHGAAALGCT
jgi:hypothetical protein